MFDLINSNLSSAVVALSIFLALVFAVRWGVLNFIEEKMTQEIPVLLRVETMAVCREKNIISSFCFFVSSVELVGVMIFDASLFVLSLFGFLIFLGSAAYIKGMSLWMIYKRVIALNQMSQFVGKMTHLKITTRLCLTLSSPLPNKREKIIDFFMRRHNFDRYYSLLMDGEVIVFFHEEDINGDSFRWIEHIVSTGHEEAQYRIKSGAKILTLVQK